MIILAVLFLVTLFLIKDTSFFKNISTSESKITAENGLTVGNATIEDLVNKDSNGNGIPDWEEALYGLDPTKKETADGIPNSTVIAELKGKQGKGVAINDNGSDAENLTQTEKFSRELFATMAATSQNGSIDQPTIDALSAALAEKVQNPVVRKVFALSDLKMAGSDDKKAVNNYMDALTAMHKKYPALNYTALDVLQEFTADENNPNLSVLKKLDPIIAQTNKIIDSMLKTDVPPSLSGAHLNVLNSLERLAENLSDIELYDSDAVVAFGAISQYNLNTTALDSDINNLKNMLRQKLNN